MSIRIDYMKLIESINKDEYEEYYRVHNLDDVAEHFNLHSGNVAATLARKLGIVKTKEDIRQTLFNTNMKRYGSKWAQCSDKVRNKISKTVSSTECKERMQKTCKERYGVENIFQDRDYIKSCMISKYGVENIQQIPEISIKTVETRRKIYGENLEGITHKIANTRTEKYGKYFTEEMADKSRKTKLERYGDPNYCNVDKARKTSLDRYGETHYNKTQMYRDLFTTEHVAKMKQKEYETKSRNGTFNSSKGEELCYEKLCLLFSKDLIKRQYRDERYPFCCDFYVESEDLFIEYNGCWTHGEHPFNPEDECDLEYKAILEQKAETGQFYRNVLINWTVSDCNKINYAISNKLNYIVLYPESGYYLNTDARFEYLCKELITVK